MPTCSHMPWHMQGTMQVRCNKTYGSLPMGMDLWWHERQPTVVDAAPVAVDGQPAPMHVDATQLLEMDLDYVLVQHPWVGNKLTLHTWHEAPILRTWITWMGPVT